MKKSLLTVALLATALSLSAQNAPLMHIDQNGLFYVGKDALVYNGGGLQTKDNGKVRNQGNIMIVGQSADVLKTIDNSGTGNLTTGNNIILEYVDQSLATTTSGYGQLYISGLAQANITGIVDKQYAAVKHGSFQQISVPFVGKSFSSLSTELAGNFTNNRWSKSEILKWSNANVRWDGSVIPSAPITSATQAGITIDVNSSTPITPTGADKTAYYAVGTNSFIPTTIHTVKGIPFTDGLTGTGGVIQLNPSNITTYGPGGTSKNIYQEIYNTYIGDTFDNISPWNNTFGKYIYQFSNPYLTNLDLSLIGFDETQNSGVTSGDNNAISNIFGVASEPKNVVYSNTTGTTSQYDTSNSATFDPVSHKTTGNVTALLIKPMSTFKIKLRTNASATLDFDNLRRFNNTLRSEYTSYSPTAKTNSNLIIKQLGVIALDANQNVLGETYYVVAPQFYTGYIQNAAANSVQATTSANSLIQTFEEDPTGGVDSNYSGLYRLYINEANETNFEGKKIAMKVVPSMVKYLKFELRDDVQLVPNGTSVLSAGKSFYYNTGNGSPIAITQNDVIPVNNIEDFGLFYGLGGSSGTLGASEVKTPSRTVVVYNPEITKYVVRFDGDWKKADVEVFDPSGKLVISAKDVKTSSDFVLNLDSSNKSMYLVKVVGDTKEIVNAKILVK